MQGLSSHCSTHFTNHTGHIKSSQSVTVFTSCCLVAASNGKCSPSSGFSNCPWPQLPASHSNSSQQLNPSGSLTHSLSLSLSLTHSLSHSLTHSTPLTDSSLTCNAYNILACTTQKTLFLCLLCNCCICVCWGCPCDCYSSIA
jgi:hypothetical protein